MNKRALWLLVVSAAVACNEQAAAGFAAGIADGVNSSSPAAAQDRAAAAAAVPMAPVIDKDFLHAYSESRSFSRGSPRGAQILPDGSAVLFLRSGARENKQSLYEMKLASGEVRELLSPEALDKGPEQLTQEERARRERMRITSSGFTSFALSKDGKITIVILSGKMYALELATGKTHLVEAGAGAAIDPHLSPDAKWVAYVQANDVHVAPVDGKGKPRAVTKGGSDAKTHGLADFISAEELDRFRGFWWSPDSRSILYEEADTSGVEQLTISDPSHPEKPADKFPYPRPGHPNAKLKFGIANLNGETRWLDWDSAQFPYVAHAGWSEHAPPTLVVFDRLQKNQRVLLADVKSGKTREAIAEHDDAWVDENGSVPRWLPDGSAFLWISERDGDARLGLVSPGNPAVKWLTPPGMQVEGVSDATQEGAIFAATSDGLHRQVMSVAFDGSAPKTIAKIDDGVVYAGFREGEHQLFLAYESSQSGLNRQMVRSLDGTVARELPSLAEKPPLPKVEHEDVGPNHVHVAFVRPRSFVRGARYPIIDSAYGGPGVQDVQLDPRGMLLEQWMADATGAIVVSIDSEGTPGRGRAWERAFAGKLGGIEVDGHIAALRALAAAHPEMDASRIGVYGWSYGGYFSAMAVLRHPEVFSAGVAIAPVVDWRDYDTGYTERYLGLPEQNAAAYDAASVLTYVKPVPAGAREPAFLLMHGTADDNVYFLNSMKLIDALEQAGRNFTFLPFLGQTHQIASPADIEVVWSRAAKTLREGLAR